MNTVIKNVFIFLLGATTGVVAANALLRKKYNDLAEEEISHMREYYDSKIKETEDEDTTSEPENDPVESTATFGTLSKMDDKGDITNYTMYASQYNNEECEDDDDDSENEDEDDFVEEDMKRHSPREDSSSRPVVISPDEFGEDNTYDSYYFTYFEGDHCLMSDDDEEPVEDVERIIGYDNLSHIGEYEEGLLHIRNDILRCYYEIALDVREYREVFPEYFE